MSPTLTALVSEPSDASEDMQDAQSVLTSENVEDEVKKSDYFGRLKFLVGHQVFCTPAGVGYSRGPPLQLPVGLTGGMFWERSGGAARGARLGRGACCMCARARSSQGSHAHRRRAGMCGLGGQGG